MSHLRNIVATVTAMAAAACGCLLSNAAEATTYASRMAVSAPLTFCPGTGGLCQSAEASVSAGSAVNMTCWVNPASDPSHRYFYVQTPNNTEGFVHAGAVVQNTQTRTPACNTLGYYNAAQWALGQDGKIQVPANARNGNPAVYWSGWCWLFAYDAWKLGAGKVARYSGDSAQLTYDAYATAHLMHGVSPNPPRGSLVFFSYGGPKGSGHVGISLGSGWIENTQGNLNQHEEVTHQQISKIGLAEIGFVLPGNI